MPISDIPVVPGPYSVMLNEAQRLALIDALRVAGVGGDVEIHPLGWWICMLEALPAENTEPGMLHGFCL